MRKSRYLETRELKRSDNLCVDITSKNILKGKIIKNGAVVFDFGNNYKNRGVCGDVDFDSFSKTAFDLTPVPGDVCPVVSATLLQNILSCTRLMMDTLACTYLAPF